MPESKELEAFNKSHPWPDGCGVKSLFKFGAVDLENIGRLEDLLQDQKLYCSSPTKFNDPFECKPNFRWPSNARKVQEIRQYLIKVARNNGKSRKEAERMVSESIKTQKFREGTIFKAIRKAFSELRICCFTEGKENLLLWSHYANSHKGFCVEYDATIPPFSYAYKVQYKNEYPEVLYPRPTDAAAFTPALVKSKIWNYEKEFRIIFTPEVDIQPPNDGKSLLLAGHEMKNIYLGSEIQNKEKDTLLKLVERSKFNPRIWETKISESSFSLEFTQIQ